MFYFSKKTFDQLNPPIKMSGMLVWSTRWGQINSWVPPQILMSKCANHNRLATLHLEHVDCLIFLTTKMQNNNKIINPKNQRVSKCWIEWSMWAQRPFLHEHQESWKFTFTKINIIDVHAKFAFEWQPLIGINTLTWAPNITNTWRLPILTFSCTF